MIISIEYEKLEQAARGMEEIREKIIQEKVQAEEQRIFREKVADGTLVLFRGLESVRNISKEVLFCNVKTRAKLLEQFDYREANFIVSDCIPDREIYLLTDKKIKKSILKRKSSHQVATASDDQTTKL